MKIVLVTGGFDPLHSGHIAYFEAAKKLGTKLWVGVNSDKWLARKKGKAFMPVQERKAIINALACVDRVFEFNDDNNTANNAIYKVLSQNPDTKIVFANGGDRTNTTTPEYEVYKNTPWVEFVFGVGGEDKKNSSSWILKEWSQPTVERSWGSYTVLHKGPSWQVKELAFGTDIPLSDQRHFIRSEHWHVVEGEVQMNLEYPDGNKKICILESGDSIDIPVNTWHKAINVGSVIAKVIEVWMGPELTEDDIERRD